MRTLWTGHSSATGLTPATHPARTDPRLASVPLLTDTQPTTLNQSAVHPWLQPPPVKAALVLVKAGTSSLSQNKTIFFATLNSCPFESIRGSATKAKPEISGSISGRSASTIYINDFRTPVRFCRRVRIVLVLVLRPRPRFPLRRHGCPALCLFEFIRGSRFRNQN